MDLTVKLMWVGQMWSFLFKLQNAVITQKPTTVNSPKFPLAVFQSGTAMNADIRSV